MRASGLYVFNEHLFLSFSGVSSSVILSCLFSTSNVPLRHTNSPVPRRELSYRPSAAIRRTTVCSIPPLRKYSISIGVSILHCRLNEIVFAVFGSVATTLTRSFGLRESLMAISKISRPVRLRLAAS